MANSKFWIINLTLLYLILEWIHLLPNLEIRILSRQWYMVFFTFYFEAGYEHFKLVNVCTIYYVIRL